MFEIQGKLVRRDTWGPLLQKSFGLSYPREPPSLFVGAKTAIKLQKNSIAQWLAYLLPGPAAPGSIPSIPEICSREKLLMRPACLVESGK